jgi:HMG-box domain
MKRTEENPKEGDEARKPPATPTGQMQSSDDDEGSEGSAEGFSVQEASIGKRQTPGAKKRKKHKDMPRWALSAYNIFFRDERARILKGRQDSDQGVIGRARAAELFSAMVKTIAKRWKQLSPNEMVAYTEAAGGGHDAVSQRDGSVP